MSNKKLAGLWIDNNKAVLTTNHDTQEVNSFSSTETFKLQVQHGNSNENAGNNAEKTNKLKLYKEIEKAITNSEELYITGPGVAQEELKNHLLETPQYKNLKISLGTAHQMSDEQVLDTIKSYFKA